MVNRIYCTYCDHRYLPRALTLIESMKRYAFEGAIWLFCLSDECADILARMNVPNIKVVRLSELEDFYPELLAVKSNRETIEYYYTCSPAILHYAFAHDASAEWVTFLDSDLWFFSSPDAVFDQAEGASTIIIPHNFTPNTSELARFGKFNVGWVSFHRDVEGERCLNWWRERCIEWCYGRLEGNRYADQRYLDRFSEIAPRTKDLQHKGCNLGPWNIDNVRIALKDGVVYADQDPLIFFHFSGIKQGFGYFYFDNHRLYRAQHSRIIRNCIYRPYIANLLGAIERVRLYSGDADEKIIKPRGAKFAGIEVKNFLRSIRRFGHQILDLLQGRPIFVWGKTIL